MTTKGKIRVYGEPIYLPHMSTALTGATTLTAATQTLILAGPEVAANWYEVGRQFAFYAAGAVTIPTAARTLTVSVNLNGTAGNLPVTLAFASGAAIAAPAAFRIMGSYTCRSVGAAGTFIGSAQAVMIGATVPVQAAAGTATVTLDTTAASTPGITGSWDATTNTPTITFADAGFYLIHMRS